MFMLMNTATAHSHLFTDSARAVNYMIGGRAKVTFVSKATGVRFTYKISSKPARSGDGLVYFVSVLTGSNNESDYSWMGMISTDGVTYRHGGAKAKVGSAAPSAKAFVWVWERLTRGVLPAQLSIYHEGTCGRCGRTLTVDSSILSGFGPECAERSMGA